MKRYRLIHEYSLEIQSKSEYRFEEAGEVILSPKIGKVFLHWYSPSGKLSSTFTLDSYLLCSTPVVLVNNTEENARVQVIKI
jgi:hypothetical protein